MKHKHHIIPKYLGGTDDPSNLIELTIEEHARAHYVLWNLHGRWQDKVAWKGLFGMIGKDEILREMGRNSQYLFTREKTTKWWQDPVYREKVLPGVLSAQPRATEAALSLEARQKRKETFQRIGHNKGSKNPMFGRMWITNGTYSYLIDKSDSIPEGYRKGRTI